MASKQKKSNPLAAHTVKLGETVDHWVQDFMSHVSKVETQLKDIKDQVKRLDTHKAKAAVEQLSASGLSEFHKIQVAAIKQFSKIKIDYSRQSKKLGLETGRLVRKARKTIKELRSQVKSIADAERDKRRGRRRSE